ncbi:iron-sulfur cluster assembly scaffold protein [Phosphitispora fastidiosa]|uniref:iron-sulfur cluster assembly scaffold protein n=1 Tax=Phosphitispora fastidiosa TaxID=2837202 RepID=UPI001E403038|nr:iron-sulfur cluster assembly scaffold protein [Phosphitispora fastidiosa]MBU7005786.1 nitrogen fixation NifU-like protein [Phosphitispora fastidiosa]
MFSETVMDHFQNPRNVGRIETHDGEGIMGSGECGDYLVITIKVCTQEVITDIKFQVKGCVAAVAASSMTTELAKGKHVYDALNISEIDIVDALGGLPDEKIHCSVLGAGALKKAIYDYLGKKYIAEN